MTLADTNFWLAISFSKHVFHHAAQDWYRAQSTDHSVFFCRFTQHSFLRLLTTEATTRQYDFPALTNAAAWQVYDGFVADRRIGWAPEPAAERLDKIWKVLATRGTASPKLWMDAYLAAFAIAGGYRLVTADRGFMQFGGLDVTVLEP